MAGGVMRRTARQNLDALKRVGAAGLFLAALAFWGTVIYVAVHFIAKFW